MATINPYLTFVGTCEEAFNFYRSVFGGDFLFLGRFSEMPDEHGIPQNQKEKIMHVSLPISSETILMGSDSFEPYAKGVIMGNNFSISITAQSKNEADTLFASLAEGGEITMPMGDTFWGSYFGTLTDKFGVQWMMSFDKNSRS